MWIKLQSASVNMSLPHLSNYLALEIKTDGNWPQEYESDIFGLVGALEPLKLNLCIKLQFALVNMFLPHLSKYLALGDQK